MADSPIEREVGITEQEFLIGKGAARGVSIKGRADIGVGSYVTGAAIGWNRALSEYLVTPIHNRSTKGSKDEALNSTGPSRRGAQAEIINKGGIVVGRHTLRRPIPEIFRNSKWIIRIKNSIGERRPNITWPFLKRCR
jgi:hypothetical protein